jgi:hypothetical protein
MSIESKEFFNFLLQDEFSVLKKLSEHIGDQSICELFLKTMQLILTQSEIQQGIQGVISLMNVRSSQLSPEKKTALQQSG